MNCIIFRHQNECSSSPCVHNATCLNGFTDKRYKCLCPIGYTGGNCEIATGKIEHILEIYCNFADVVLNEANIDSANEMLTGLAPKKRPMISG